MTLDESCGDDDATEVHGIVFIADASLLFTAGDVFCVELDEKGAFRVSAPGMRNADTARDFSPRPR